MSDDPCDAYPKLRELTLEPGTSKSPLCDTCEFVQITSNVRLYWKARLSDGDRSGFSFMSVDWCQGAAVAVGEPVPEMWTGDVRVEPLFWGRAYWDGVRHLHFGFGEYVGYHNYPDLEAIEGVVKFLRELEGRYCRPLNER